MFGARGDLTSFLRSFDWVSGIYDALRATFDFFVKQSALRVIVWVATAVTEISVTCRPGLWGVPNS